MKTALPQTGQSQPRQSYGKRGNRQVAGGFTLFEVLVVVAVLVVFTGLMMPVLSNAKQKARGVQCLANLRQLSLGWTMYAGDNNGSLVSNGELGTAGVESPADPALQPGGAKAQWCPGNVRSNGAAAMPFGNQYIQAGLLYPFVNNLKIYKCPADQSVWPLPPATGFARVRSVSMNCWLDPVARSWNAIESYSGGKAQKVFTKFSSINESPGPGGIWVFIDESPATIDDGYFVCDRAVNAWVCVPASGHSGAGTVSFADGHVVARQWHDPKVLDFADYSQPNPAIPLNERDDASDLRWLQQASSVFVRPPVADGR